MLFRSGDAIAGILITFVNVIGGIIIGVLQQGMQVQQALQTYTILTVGDGLISQIPALIISTAAGVVVTKVTTEATLGSQLVTQFALQPRALGTAAGILFLLGWIPGLPGFPLLTLAVLRAPRPITSVGRVRPQQKRLPPRRRSRRRRQRQRLILWTL